MMRTSSPAPTGNARLVLLPLDLYARFARKHTARHPLSPAEREDCAAGFVLHMLQHPPAANASSSRALLDRCAANFVANYCRSRERRLHHEVALQTASEDEGETFEGALPAAQDSPIAPLLHTEIRQRILLTMQSLTRAQRNAILRHFLHDQSYAEIAAAAGSKPETVRMCITRGLLRLRTMLIAQGFTEMKLREYLSEFDRS